MTNSLLKISIIFLLTGFVLVFLAVLLPILTLVDQAKTSSGIAGCVILFFIPICFGFGESGILSFMMILSLVLTLVLVVFAFLVFRKLTKNMYVE